MNFQDALNRDIFLSQTPQRIISLCPSLTETLFELGLAEKIVGRTRFCIHPKEKVKKILSVGGTKEVKYERFEQLKPDIIFAVKEENTLEMVQELEKKYQVYVFDIETIEDALQMIVTIGEITNTREEANQLYQKITTAWQKIYHIFPSQKVAYFIWKNPYMLAGKQTFIHEVLAHLGLQNMAIDLAGRYPIINEPDLQTMQPDWILLSSEPYPFGEKEMQGFSENYPYSKTIIIDGEMFSWYGSRMLLAADYFMKWKETI